MKPTDSSPPSVAVVIPSYKVTRHILQVIASTGDDVDHIIVVDDACPEGSGKLVESGCSDPRVCVVYHAQNQGVGGAVLTGYQRALELGADIIVKIDGDGQMDPALLPNFVAPIAALEADYTKGNRFYDLRNIGQMPAIRLFGNAALSFMAKVSTGYWDLFDPTNGYTAISARVAALLPFERISRRYFFETDLLFRLGTFRAVVVDIPMDARYGDEVSNLRIGKVLTEFLLKHGRNFFKRVFYSYFLRDMSLASLELLAGCALVLFGVSTLLMLYVILLMSQYGANLPMVGSLPLHAPPELVPILAGSGVFATLAAVHVTASGVGLLLSSHTIDLALLIIAKAVAVVIMALIGFSSGHMIYLQLTENTPLNLNPLLPALVGLIGFLLLSTLLSVPALRRLGNLRFVVGLALIVLGPLLLVWL